MVLEVTDVLFAALGDVHAPRVAREAVRELLLNADGEMHALFFGSILIAHHDGADRVETARAFELADGCIGAIERAVVHVHAQEQPASTSHRNGAYA